MNESERRWRSIVENPFDYVIVIRRDRKIVFINRMGGYRPEDIIERATPFDFVAERHHDDMRTAYSAVFDRGEAASYEVYVPENDRWYASIVGPIPNAEGTIVEASILTRDITEHKRAEIDLAARERRVRTALAAAAEGLFDVDPQTGAAYFADRIYQLMACQPGDNRLSATLQSLQDRVVETDKPHVEMCLRNTLENTVALDCTFRGHRFDREIRWFHARGALVSGPEGEPRLMGFLSDVTEAHHAEEARKQLEDQVNQMQKLDTLGRLAGGIAHDFNNLLGPVQAQTELALSKLDAGHDAVRHMEAVLNASRRASSLVNQILTFARRGGESWDIFDVRTAVADALRLVRLSVPPQVELVAASNTPAFPVRGDASQIVQVVVNLCANALQALGSSPGRVEVRLREQQVTPDTAPAAEGGSDDDREAFKALHPGAYVRIDVLDNGPGISADVRARLFEPFFTTRKDSGGTGLGLSVVHGIAHRHGGSVWVTSAPAQGTRFSVCLPRHNAEGAVETTSQETSVEVSIASGSQASVPAGLSDTTPEGSAPTTGPAQPAALPGSAGSATRGLGKVLCVDDQEPVLLVLTEILRASDFDVEGHADPEAALEAFSRRPTDYCLVVSDVSMPGLQGDELARHIRFLNSQIPIVLTTGYSETVDEAAATRAGVNAYLKKPYSMQSLLDIVNSVMGIGSAPQRGDT